MRFVSAQTSGESAGQLFLGLLEDDRVHPVPQFSEVAEALAAGADLDQLAAEARAGTSMPLDEVRLLTPVRPPAMRDCMCFHEHIRNCRPGTFDPRHEQFPAFYISNHNAVIGPEDPVQVPPGCQTFDYELEVCAVLGRELHNPTPEEARAAIAGYTLYIDWSARDLQMEEMALGLGPAKGKDSATTLGPHFVTADELEPRRAGKGFDLRMRAWVNDRLVTDGSWKTINWDFGDVIAYAGRGTTLSAGEVLGSGTVGGGCLLEHERTGSEAFSGWLQPGDTVKLEVELLGSLTQTVAEGLPRHPLSSGH
ncbi:fumarylacetoacetate hydrolase family protein [Brevibacterium album]|uniref:fumarylacetoacetate hydrolase family protein n=1 Tax=Brevibacterium album TaxID=417948 RepID=UPI000427BE25|nr:fumarylacetoacetate hydrolase family protein [Brevibacterium album]